jgi:small subunit ribosomal protein S6
MMNNYEVLYVIDGTLSDEAIKEQVARFTDLVTANGGEVVQVDEWGKRRLAYQINYKSEGYYVLMNFKSEPDFPAELERNFGINEAIIRYMVERKAEGYVPPKKVAKPKVAEKPAEPAKPVEKPAEAEAKKPAEEAKAESSETEEAKADAEEEK